MLYSIKKYVEKKAGSIKIIYEERYETSMGDRNPILGSDICTQIGLLVHDIEKTAEEYAKFFGIPKPEIGMTGEFDSTNTHYMGESTPARSKLAFFDIGNLQIELIQPDSSPSVWRHDLEKNGEGIHHIAFRVNGMDKIIELCADNGMKLVQRGKWDTGHYAYLDASDTLKLTLELLENGDFTI